MNASLTRLCVGAFAGLLATAPMSAVMFLWHRRLPWLHRDPLPPAKITHAVLESAGLQDVSLMEEAALTTVNHFAYGAATGAAYGLIAPQGSAANAVNAGIVYGLGVWTASYVGWLPAVGLHRPATDEPADRNLLMLTAHVVWGGALGLLTHMALQGPRERSTPSMHRLARSPADSSPSEQNAIAGALRRNHPR
jgi:uncharacterized membrane protein YagU involved in acid resistance